MLKVKSVIKLDDGKIYLVSKSFAYNDEIYYLLMEVYNSENIKFVVVDPITKKLVLVEDSNLIRELILQ